MPRKITILGAEGAKILSLLARLVTAFARPRVVGVASAAGPADGAAELAAAVVLDRRHVVRCVARCQGEDGLYGARAVRARVGAGGVSEILGAPRTSRPAP
ncbi:MAG: hypothetical protein ACXVFK_18860 [Solirubrobacteraceae bacterium]